MHFSLFAMLVMHGPQGARPPTPGSTSSAGACLGVGVDLAIVGVPWVAELCSNQQGQILTLP